jgi:hypothetical protein
VKIAKDPFEFSINRISAKRLVAKDSKDFSFAHCSLIIFWLLISQVWNGLGIKFGHLEWENDSMVRYYGKIQTWLKTRSINFFY